MNLYIFSVLILSCSGSHIKRFSFKNLESVSSNEIKQSLEVNGAIAITGLPEQYSNAVQSLKSEASRCLEIGEYPERVLPDGSTRKTFATDSENGPEYPECIKDESEVISRYFSDVDMQVSSLIMEIVGNNHDLQWMEGEKMGNFASAGFKDHIHVYTGSDNGTRNNQKKAAVPFHSDNGLLLLLTPFKEQPLLMKNKNGDVLTTGELDNDSVIVIIASALPNWLLKGTNSPKFYPASHSVPALSEIATRTVFARMKIAPETAVARKGGATFSQFFHNNIEESLCPGNIDWTQMKKQECGDGQAYCWMDCLDLPADCGETDLICVNQDMLPCCTLEITEDCLSMDDSCEWQCGAM